MAGLACQFCPQSYSNKYQMCSLIVISRFSNTGGSVDIVNQITCYRLRRGGNGENTPFYPVHQYLVVHIVKTAKLPYLHLQRNNYPATWEYAMQLSRSDALCLSPIRVCEIP